MSTNEIQLRFGALAPPLKQQLAGQALKPAGNRHVFYQKTLDAVTRLHVIGYLSDRDAHKIRVKVAGRIEQEVTQVRVRPARGA